MLYLRGDGDWSAAMRILILLAGALLVTACADTRPPGTTPFTPSPAAQPSGEVRDAQQRLRSTGLYNGPLDGLYGTETRGAVERFQATRGLKVTSRLDDQTLNTLASVEAGTALVALSNATDVRTVQNRLRQLNFYNGPADGMWGTGSQLAVENFQRARGLRVGRVNEGTISAMGLDPASFPSRAAVPGRVLGSAPAAGPLDRRVVRNIQQRLRQRGYNSGAPDGRWGPRTERALVQFQRSRGLEATGNLTPATAAALGLNSNDLSQNAPAPRRR
jgi:peptidoglycan hydrolase-like protein with peptidoglycan-binding domain